jgi:S-adenosylmethionine:tRNA ribosyltransferase-isomerase
VRTSDFDYELPRELIAQYPAERRDESRLLVVRRGSATATSGVSGAGAEEGTAASELEQADLRFEHRRFRDIVEYLRPGDLLVLNDTRVIPARLMGRRASGGRAEMFLLRELGDARWEVLVRPGARIRTGDELSFGGGDLPRLAARVLEAGPEGKRTVALTAETDIAPAIEELGAVPLPPYIDRAPEPVDATRYQTVYARERGAVAPPTAGLHFTESLLDKLSASGVSIARLTLHVGAGTFRPVTADDPSLHRMESERYIVTHEAAEAVNAARDGGGRVVAVGTTSVRTLESIAGVDGHVEATSGSTDLFIRPPYRFRCVNALVTNFHLPRSTLLMLVSAFAGRELVLAAYQEAVRERYRFYSYGDAMLIL